MKIWIDTTKSLEENAAHYYEKSKKAKQKLEGLKKAIHVSKKKLQSLEKDEEKAKVTYEKPPEKKWYMKFRYFTSSDGFLCFGGRDAGTNELIIKKHTEKGDLVFHTDLVGSPFFVIKAEGKTIPKKTREEVANATVSFSRAWREEIGNAEVYCITPEQVKKELGLPKGSFMIHGKREYFKAIVGLYITTNKENYLECTPIKQELQIIQGGKRSDTAKKIQHIFMKEKKIKYELDDIIRILPGDCSLKKVKR